VLCFLPIFPADILALCSSVLGLLIFILVLSECFFPVNDAFIFALVSSETGLPFKEFDILDLIFGIFTFGI
jgi:hypothetical protein